MRGIKKAKMIKKNGDFAGFLLRKIQRKMLLNPEFSGVARKPNLAFAGPNFVATPQEFPPLLLANQSVDLAGKKKTIFIAQNDILRMYLSGQV